MRRRAVGWLGLFLILATGDPARAAPSPAERAIATAEVRVTRAPDPGAYAALAFAQARRARETAEVRYYDAAEASLARGEALAPGDLALARARIWVLLGKHEFAQARAQAEALNRRVPDDPLIYAMLVDATLELGDYAAAEAAAQWLLDLRPGNVLGLTRAAYLRELFGDIEGALELMQQAQVRTPSAETEDHAWLLTQMAHLQLAAGRVPESAELVAQALERFPGYHYALAQRAQVEAARGDWGAAASTLRAHVRAAPHPENSYYLGQMLMRAGDQPGAVAAFAEFEENARAEVDRWDNANRELVYYYADVARRADAALRVAEVELARRRDLHTRMAWAWALHCNGRHEEARAASEEALAIGTRDPELWRRAGLIARAAGDETRARELLAGSLARAPWQEGGMVLGTQTAAGGDGPARLPQAPSSGRSR